MWFSLVLHSTARLAAVLAFAIAGASFESFQIAPGPQGCETIALPQGSQQAVDDLTVQPCRAPQSPRAAVCLLPSLWFAIGSPALDLPAGTRSGPCGAGNGTQGRLRRLGVWGTCQLSSLRWRSARRRTLRPRSSRSCAARRCASIFVSFWHNGPLFSSLLMPPSAPLLRIPRPGRRTRRLPARSSDAGLAQQVQS